MFTSRSAKALPVALVWVFGLSLLVCLPAWGQATYASRAGQVIAAGEGIPDEVAPAPAMRLVPLFGTVPDLPALSRAISLRLQGVTLEHALKQIAAKGGLNLAYLRETVSEEERVTLDREGITVLEALREVLREANLALMHAPGGQFVVVDRPEAKLPARGVQAPLHRSAVAPVRLEPAELQAGTITGTVTDSTSGEPLPGVNVVIQGTQQGASTDMNGEYTISEVEAGTYTLVASFIGYGDEVQEGVVVNADDTTMVDFVLETGELGLDELVVIGYGTAERRDVTGSIGSISVGEETETQALTNAAQLLQGRVPGLQAGIATQADGRTALQVRGQNSIHAGNSPLIVVDGVPFQGSLSDLNPHDIRTIDVLKGASAAAVYGASAAAGVIAVTTKQGITPEPTFNFKSSIGVATQGALPQPYGPEGYIQFTQDALTRLDPTAPEYYFADPRDLPSDITLEEWMALGKGGGEPVEIWLGRLGFTAYEIQNYVDGKTIDWYDRVFQEAALRQNYNLSVSGNPEDVSYYLSLGYIDNQGELVGERFKTIRARTNLSATVTDWLEVGLNSWYANRDEGFLGPAVGHATQASPYGEMYAEDGTLRWHPHNAPTVFNPFLWTTQSGREYEWRNQHLRASLRALIDLPLDLEYEVRWTNDYNFRQDYLFNPSSVPFGEPGGNATRNEHTGYTWQVDNILTWSRTIADVHSFDATFLFNVEVEEDKLTTAYNEQFPIEALGYSGIELGSQPSVSNSYTRATGTALMGRLNYQLLDRYLFTVSYRQDGYSAFGRKHPYAYFPAAAFAWRVSEEPFFNVDPISNLKLRLSWGVNGNRSIGPYSALQRLNADKYIYGTESVLAISAENLPNPNLQWERTTQYNVGLDFGLFSDRLTSTIDAYYMSTSNLLLRRRLPNITGYNSIWTNLGEVVNRGLEVSVSSTNIQNEIFTWNSTLNFSLNRNEIVHLYGTQVPVRNEAGEIIGYREANDWENNWFIGHSLHQIFDYKILGVWQQDEAEEAAKYGKEPGDFKLLDVNGDGVLSPREDKVFQDYTEPRYRVSLANNVSYKNFTASALITAHLGVYAIHNTHMHSSYGQGSMNKLAFPYWTPSNPTNEWARLASDSDNPVFNYWENTSFVRLQSLSVAYQIPESLTGLSGANSIRVFFNARNVFVLTGYDGADPETHEHTPRLYMLGVNLTF